jgi:phosphatidylinositol alpha-1,6-mannosyltransferase
VTAHTLVITNDFPPRSGGIQTFGYELVSRLDPGHVTVLTSSYPGDRAFDAAAPFDIVRSPRSVLLPTRSTWSLAHRIVTDKGVRRVVFGAMAPLGLLAPRLRSAGVSTMLAMSMGHEVGWAMTPGLRQALRRIGDSVDRVTYLTEYTRDRIAPALSPAAAAAMRQLAPGVDTAVFHPGQSSAAALLRTEFGIGNRPVIVCVSRLMKRKGQDKLIEALPLVRDAVPDAMLVIVGRGSYGPTLSRQVANRGLDQHVLLTGEVPAADLPAWYAVGDVFAMPCRTRNAGWDVEGLGIVFLEASATGLPVLAGNSGGAPDAVREGVSGFVVDGAQVPQIAERLTTLLLNPRLRATMGSAGRDWVTSEWTWEHSAERFRAMLDGWELGE